MRPRRSNRVFASLTAAAMLVAAAGCDGNEPPAESEIDKPDLGLLTTLPIYWNETAELGEMLSDQGDAPWTRAVLEAQYDLVLLDSLAGEAGVEAVDQLLLAQPRALSAKENVALDNWVRAGGRVLIFADPLLTSHSRFHIGDRRRPQDVVLLSPILGRWGLELAFDPDQSDGERIVDADGIFVPVNLRGAFRPSDASPDCDIIGDGLIANCSVGKGRAIIVADAAVFDLHEGDSVEARGEILSKLLERAFAVGPQSGTGGDRGDSMPGTSGDEP